MVDTTNFLYPGIAPGVRAIRLVRDYALYEITLSKSQAQRVAVLFDADHDMRSTAVLGALVIYDRNACADLLAIAESKGRLKTYWAARQPQMIRETHAKLLRSAVQHAADAALFASGDEFTAEEPEFVPVLADGKLAYGVLPTEHPLRVVPFNVTPGRVEL